LGDGAIYDIVATQDAVMLKPQEGNAVAQGLQQQAIDRRSSLNCEPVTTPVQTPSGRHRISRAECRAERGDASGRSASASPCSGRSRPDPAAGDAAATGA
jgi:hypothetical protein